MAQQQNIKEALPQTGQLFHEDVPASVLCKPKILPLKSVTLEKLEKMQREAQETVLEQEALEKQQQQEMFQQPNPSSQQMSDTLSLE